MNGTVGWAEKARFGIVGALIVACFLWGGASRLDIPGLILLQPLAVLCAAAVLVLPGEIRWAAVRTPLIFLGALAIIIAVQLVPLPPALWASLPGHEQLLPLAAAGGEPAPWRPLTLTPDLTLSSLVGLVVPAAALIGFGGLTGERARHLLAWLLVAAALGSLLGLAQLLGGPGSGFYRYAVTNSSAAVGFFSNRNHQAMFLVMVWPMLAVWAAQRQADPGVERLRRAVALSGAVALLPMIAVTGSRGGLVLAPISLAASWWLLRKAASDRNSAPLRWVWIVGPFVAAVVVLGAAILFARAEAFERIFSTSVGDEARLSYWPVLVTMIQDFFPFGSGFGSFDPLFRFYEPDSMIRPTYLNHAHNDLLELLITGGVPAALLALAFVVWAGGRLVAAVRDRGSARTRFAFLGGTMIFILLFGSLLDYPLRTPLHAMLFAFACGWLASPAPGSQGADRG